ncbi:MAG: acyltransferase [Ruminococcaceae bacterium]|nr:acyltransferase [Oscillospiraceae bacterium]
MKGRTYIYGNPYKMFSTEPWCVTLGDNVHITNEVVFVCHDGGTLVFRHLVPDLEITKPITVGDNVFIGTRSIIMPGVHIGNNVIIAAGSVVSKDLPDNGVYGGVPAKFIKPMDEYFEKIQQESLHLGHLKGKEKDRELRKVLLKQE